MIRHHRAIDRRTLLRATGVALALPFLEAMRPAWASAQEAPPRRMVNIGATLGLYADSWFPKATGVDYEASEYLALIDGHRARYSLFSGLCHQDQTGRQAHNSEITWLTAAKHPGLDGFQNTISIDQLAAGHFGYVTRLPSIVLGTLSPQSQSYTQNGVMVPAETSPAKLFAQLFLQGAPADVLRETQSLSDGGSILDRLKSETAALRRRASSADQYTLDAYFDAVRAAERDLVEAQAWLNTPKPKVSAKPPTDVDDPTELIARLELMLGLIPLIVETDSSRVISLMIQDHGVVPKVAGVTADQHSLSHHGQDETKIVQLRKVETEIVAKFGELLTALDARQEGDGTLLDHTTVLFGSNLGNANSHVAVDLPILVAGGGLPHGRHHVVGGKGSANNAPLSNLFVTILNNVGIPTEAFGQSSGALAWS